MDFRDVRIVALGLVLVIFKTALLASNYEVEVEGAYHERDKTDIRSGRVDVHYYPKGIVVDEAVERPYALIPFWDRLAVIKVNYTYEGSIYYDERSPVFYYGWPVLIRSTYDRSVEGIGLSGQYSHQSSNSVFYGSYQYSETDFDYREPSSLYSLDFSDIVSRSYSLEFEGFLFQVEPPFETTSAHEFNLGYAYYIAPLWSLSVDLTYTREKGYIRKLLMISVPAPFGDDRVSVYQWRWESKWDDSYRLKVSSHSIIELPKSWIRLHGEIAYETFDELGANDQYVLQVEADYYFHAETSIGLFGALVYEEGNEVLQRSIGVRVEHYFTPEISFSGSLSSERVQAVDSVIFQLGSQLRF